ncbi:YebO family protein [Acerihabitans sp. TG2]|uniref:YebO family protein n=1 Tax=Acerihabitans sp. TG2 TaxID=3096008 RepID=UPI002B2341A1|nr:YebO family protein [Acerihabitans sp. TG2]MEA9389513.1 YebO family protein [Acerihabitans sp. TG2]
MNDFGLDTLNVASLALCFIAVIIFLAIWYFLNRASVRANEQIVLLNELLEQQKMQTELLQRLGQVQVQGPSVDTDQNVTVTTDSEPVMFKDFIAER